MNTRYFETDYVYGTSAIACNKKPFLKLVYDADTDRSFPQIKQLKKAQNRRISKHDAANTSLSAQCKRFPQELKQTLLFSTILFAFFGLVLMLSAAFTSSRLDAYKPDAYQQISVSPHDSLWSIAQDYPVHGYSTAEVVELIQAENHLPSSQIIVGDTLRVPID